MGAVLLSMGLIGSWMGWEVRKGNGGDVNALTLGETISEMHPKIMGGMFFFFFLGGQVRGRPKKTSERTVGSCSQYPNPSCAETLHLTPTHCRLYTTLIIMCDPRPNPHPDHLASPPRAASS